MASGLKWFSCGPSITRMGPSGSAQGLGVRHSLGSGEVQVLQGNKSPGRSARPSRPGSPARQ